MTLRSVIVMAVLVALCVGGYLLLSEQTPGATSRWPPYMPDRLSKGDVTRAVVTAPQGRLDLRKSVDRPDHWDVAVGTDLVRADRNAVDDLLSAFTRQSVADKFARSSVTDADVLGYGLAEPKTTIELTATGKPVLVRYGKETREGTNVYVDTGPGTDIWIVAKEAFTLAISDAASGLRDRHLFDQSSFDVRSLEIESSGVTVVKTTKDPTSQEWRFEQPWKGYVLDHDFETLVLSKIVNAEWDKWVESESPDLAKYGLAPPRHVVRLVPRAEGRKPEVLLVGNPSVETKGGVYAMEEGTKSVFTVGSDFAAAVERDPLSYRDRSFTRLGQGGVVIDVNLDGARYTLNKPGATWDITAPERHPAEGSAVERVLARIREWQTVEFLDSAKSEDFGLDGKQWIEIDRAGSGEEKGEKIRLLIGREADAKSVYGRRLPDGGVERVDKAPLDEIRKGIAPLKRLDVRQLATDDISELMLAPGASPEGQKLEQFTLQRGPEGSGRPWINPISTGAGFVGALDAETINEMLAALRTIKAVEWLTYDPGKDGEKMGMTPAPATLTLSINLKSADPHDTLRLIVGRRRDDGNYFARLAEAGAKGVGDWAFVLSGDVVATLSKSIAKPLPPK